MSESSKEKALETPKELRKKQIRSIFYIIVTGVTLCVLGLAWLLNNTSVNGNGIQVQTMGSRFEVATKKSDSSKRDVHNIDSFFELFKRQDEEIASNSYDESQDNRSLSLFLTSDTNFMNYNQSDKLEPGEYGKITFYIHPLVSDIKVLYLDLQMQSFHAETDEEGSITNMTPVSTLDSGIADWLLQGHLLFFEKYDKLNNQYSDWINEKLAVYPSNKSGETIILQSSKAGGGKPEGCADAFASDQYYEVTVYWIWPKYFRNYAYLDPKQGDLFSIETDEDYVNIMSDMNTQTSVKKYFYSPPEADKSPAAMETLPEKIVITDRMENKDFNLCTLYYNEADEYLGETAGYVLLRAVVTE